jgi:hypothetical protein
MIVPGADSRQLALPGGRTWIDPQRRGQNVLTRVRLVAKELEDEPDDAAEHQHKDCELNRAVNTWKAAATASAEKHASAPASHSPIRAVREKRTIASIPRVTLALEERGRPRS